MMDLKSSDRQKTSWAVAGVPVTCFVIILVEFFERFSYYTISGSKAAFMSNMLHWDTVRSSQINGCFGAAIFAFAGLGGWVADTCLGRFLTVGFFSVLYIAGLLLTAFATEPSVQSSAMFFAGTFAFIPIASGGIKPVVSVFGADQVQGTKDDDRIKERFYSMFWWVLCLAAAIATGVMTTVATSPQSFGLPEDWGYFIAYMTSAACMLLGTILYFGASGSYHKGVGPRDQSPVGRQIFRAVVRSAPKSFRGAVAAFGWLLTIPYFFTAFYQGLANNKDIAKISLGIEIVQFTCLIWAHGDNSFIGVGERGGSFADSLSLKKIRQSFSPFPVVLIVSATYVFVFRMTTTNYATQAQQMNLNLGSGQINNMAFNLAHNVAVMFGIIVLEALVYPLLARRGLRVRMTSKLVLGIILAGLSALIALLLEVTRRNSSVMAPVGWSPDQPVSVRFPNMVCDDADGVLSCADLATMMGPCVVNGVHYCSQCATTKTDVNGIQAGIYMSQVSAFWIAIPYFIIGLAEALVMPGLQYYAYAMAPKESRALIQAWTIVFGQMYPLASATIFSTLLRKNIQNDLNRTSRILGIAMSIDSFYFVSLLFLVPTLPLAIYVIRRSDAREASQVQGADEVTLQAAGTE